MTPSQQVYHQVFHRALSISIDAASEGRMITPAEAERQAVRELALNLKAQLTQHAKSKPRPRSPSGKASAGDDLKAMLDQLNVDAVKERMAFLAAAKEAQARKSIPRYRSTKRKTRQRPTLEVIEGGKSDFGLCRPGRRPPRYEAYRDTAGLQRLKRNFSEYEG